MILLFMCSLNVSEIFRSHARLSDPFSLFSIKSFFIDKENYQKKKEEEKKEKHTHNLNYNHKTLLNADKVP